MVVGWGKFATRVASLSVPILTGHLCAAGKHGICQHEERNRPQDRSAHFFSPSIVRLDRGDPYWTTRHSGVSSFIYFADGGLATPFVARWCVVPGARG